MNIEFNGKLITHADGRTETRKDFIAVKNNGGIDHKQF
jgi:hypothetical protein